MRLNVEREAIQAGIMTVIKSLPSKPTMAILEGIYLETVESGLLLRCSDLSLQIDCIIPATIEEEGAAVLPGRLFSEFIRKIKSDTIDMDKSARTMKINAGRAHTSLQCMDPKEFPDMATGDEVLSIPLPQKLCRDMIRQTVIAIATEDSKPILTGILCEVKDGQFSMVALDGYRLALRQMPLSAEYPEKEFVVPGKSMMDISRTLQDGDEIMEMQFSNTHLLIDLGHTRIVSRLLEGNFIKYRGLLPVEHQTRVRVNREELLESIERASLLSREGGNNIARFEIRENTLKILATSPAGKLEEEMDVHLNGEPLEIAFNAKYFSDLLKVLDDEEIYLDMNNSVSPCVARPIQGNAYYYLVLPVRIFQ